MTIKKASKKHKCHRCDESNNEINSGDYYVIGKKGKCYCLRHGTNLSIKRKVDLWCRNLKPSLPI